MASRNGVRVTRSSLTSNDRKLRYKILLEGLSTLEDECNNEVRMEKTASAVQEAEVLLKDGGVEEKVKHPGEVYLDSQVLRATSDLALRWSEAVSGNINTYDRHELAAHIKENPDLWEFMFPREAPPAAYLFGTFAPTPPEHRPRAARRRPERQHLAALSAPENVDRMETTEQGSEMVRRVRRFINKQYKSNGQMPLSYFHTVLDPGSFSRTVENVYYVSYLVRDGTVAVNLDEEYELPFITPVEPPPQEESDLSEEHQFIVSINMQRWQEMIEAFDIRQPMMVLKRN